MLLAELGQQFDQAFLHFQQATMMRTQLALQLADQQLTQMVIAIRQFNQFGKVEQIQAIE